MVSEMLRGGAARREAWSAGSSSCVGRADSRHWGLRMWSSISRDIGDGKRGGMAEGWSLGAPMLVLGEELLQLGEQVAGWCIGQAAHEAALALLAGLGRGAVCWQGYLQPAGDSLHAVRVRGRGRGRGRFTIHRASRSKAMMQRLIFEKQMEAHCTWHSLL